MNIDTTDNLIRYTWVDGEDGKCHAPDTARQWFLCQAVPGTDGLFLIWRSPLTRSDKKSP